MDTVLGSAYRGKRVLMYVLKKAAHLLETAVGFRVKTAQKDKPYYVKDAYYVINALVSVSHVGQIDDDLDHMSSTTSSSPWSVCHVGQIYHDLDHL